MANTITITASGLVPDAELIMVCDRFVAIEREVRARYDEAELRGDPTDEEIERIVKPIYTEQDQLLDRMEGLRATTADGIVARSRAMAVHNPRGELSFDGPDTFTNRLVTALIRDVLALEAAPSPDAELIADCEAARRLEARYLGAFYGPGASPDGEEQFRIGAAVLAEIKPEKEALLDQVADSEAVTLEGLRAKARLFITSDPGLEPYWEGGLFDNVLASIIRDLVGEFDPIEALAGASGGTADEHA